MTKRVSLKFHGNLKAMLSKSFQLPNLLVWAKILWDSNVVGGFRNWIFEFENVFCPFAWTSPKRSPKTEELHSHIVLIPTLQHETESHWTPQKYLSNTFMWPICVVLLSHHHVYLEFFYVQNFQTLHLFRQPGRLLRDASSNRCLEGTDQCFGMFCVPGFGTKFKNRSCQAIFSWFMQGHRCRYVFIWLFPKIGVPKMDGL